MGKKTKIILATPMYGGNCTAGYTSSLLQLSKIMDFTPFFIQNESLITRARNMMTHVFLKSDATHLLFVDADIVFDAEAIPKMLEADVDIIGAGYPKKYINWDKLRNAALTGIPAIELPMFSVDYFYSSSVGSNKLNQAVEVDRIGTGMMLIKREVFEKMKDSTTLCKLGSSLYGMVSPDEYVHNYFETGIDDKTEEFLGEDWFFCQKWKNLGGKIYAAPWARTKHIGTHIFGQF